MPELKLKNFIIGLNQTLKTKEMNDQMIDLLMVLLSNDIIQETHFIKSRENVNTLEDVARELVLEYESLKKSYKFYKKLKS